MRYHDIKHKDMANGDGLRVTLFCSGCAHNCPGCQNPITHDPNDGLEFDETAKQEIYDQLSKEWISGITLSGGDPMFPSNREPMTQLARDIKRDFPNKTVWMYTGYTFEAIKNEPIVQEGLVDVMVDGRFEADKTDLALMWKGSWNQRVIDVAKTLEAGEIVLHCGDYRDPNRKHPDQVTELGKAIQNGDDAQFYIGKRPEACSVEESTGEAKPRSFTDMDGDTFTWEPGYTSFKRALLAEDKWLIEGFLGHDYDDGTPLGEVEAMIDEAYMRMPQGIFEKYAQILHDKMKDISEEEQEEDRSL